jgi:hypothetical protein
MTVGVPKESAAGERRVALVGRGEVRYDVRQRSPSSWRRFAPSGWTSGSRSPETAMLFGDAKASVGETTEELNGIQARSGYVCALYDVSQIPPS